MNPHIAIFACFILFCVFFRVDRLNTSDVSTTLWIPTVWMLIVGSRMVSQWLMMGGPDVSVDAYTEGSPLDRLVFSALIVSAFVVLMKRGVFRSELIRDNVMVFLLLLYSAISIGWSDFPFVSFKRYTKELGNLFMALVVLSERYPIKALEAIMRRCAYLLIPLSFVLYKYIPDLGRSYGRWEGEMHVTGVTNNKNSLGALCLICGILLLWSLLARWRNGSSVFTDRVAIARLSVLALTIWMLALASSATSISCSMVGAFVLIALLSEKVRRYCNRFVSAGAIAICLSFLSIELLPALAGFLGRDPTLTGRTDIWQVLLGMVTNQLIGSGYGSFWLGGRLESLWGLYSWRINEAHNGFLEVYLELGWIGITIMIGVIFSAFHNAKKVLDRTWEEGSIRITMLVIIALYNITESSFLRTGQLVHFVFMVVAISVPRSLRFSTPNDVSA